MPRKTDFLLSMSSWQIAKRAALDVFLAALGLGCALVFGVAFCLYFVNL